MGIAFQQFISKECVVLISYAKIHKTLVENKTNVIVLTPLGYLVDAIHLYEVSRWIIRIDEKQILYPILSKEHNKIVSCISECVILWHECNHPFVRQTIGIFLECRSN